MNTAEPQPEEPALSVEPAVRTNTKPMARPVTAAAGQWRPPPIGGVIPAGEFYDTAVSMGEVWGICSSADHRAELLITEDERAGVAELARLYAADGVDGAVEPDATTMVKFLRARKLDPVAAHAQLKEERQWRAVNRLDSIL